MKIINNIFIFCSLALACNAQNFNVDNIYYKMLENGTCQVVKGENAYTGEVVVPATVKYQDKNIRVSSIDGEAFKGSEITIIEIPESVEEIGKYAFSDCLHLSEAYLPYTLGKIDECLFSGDISLSIVEMPDFATSIEREAFRGCSSLKSIAIPAMIKVIEINAFASCTALESISFGNSLENIGYYSFDGCTSLKTIEIPQSVTGIAGGAFNRCSSLTKVVVPESVKSMGTDVFAYCTALEEAYLPSTLPYIAARLFKGCTALSKITIGNAVENIDGDVFNGCNNLTTFNCMTATPPACGKAFDATMLENCTLYIPIGSLEAYKTADYWKEFKKIEEKDFASVENAERDNVTVTASGNTITVKGAGTEAEVEIYTAAGKLVTKTTSKTIEMPGSGVYLVKVDNRCIKIAI